MFGEKNDKRRRSLLQLQRTTRVSGKPLKRDVTHSSCHDYNVPPYLITSISDGLCSSVALPRVKVTQAYKLVIISNSLCVLYEFWVYSWHIHACESFARGRVEEILNSIEPGYWTWDRQANDLIRLMCVCVLTGGVDGAMRSYLSWVVSLILHWCDCVASMGLLHDISVRGLKT